MRREASGISVITPFRNAQPHIRQAVDSIIEQDFTAWELVLIDDHSTDNSVAEINSLADSRIRIIAASGAGLVAALNQGIENASYPLIARMDADDIAAPTRLSQQYQYWRDNPEVSIVGAKVDIFHDSKTLGEGYSLYEQWINAAVTPADIAKQMFVESPIPHPTALFSKAEFDQLGGYRDNGWPEDYDLWCRAWLAGMKFGKPDTQPLLRWRDYPNRTSRQHSAYGNRKFLRCKAHYLSKHMASLQTNNQCSIWGAGPTGLRLHDYLQVNGVNVTHFYDVNPKLKRLGKRGKRVHIVDSKTKLKPNKDSTPCLIAVSARGAREKIEAFLIQNSWIYGKDYLLAS